MRLTLDNRRTLFKRKVKESTQVIPSFISTRIHAHIQASSLTTIMPHTDYANSPPPLRQPAPPASAMMPGRRQGSLISPAVSVAPGAFECWKRALSIGHKKSPDALASPRPAARTPVLTSRRHASRPPSHSSATIASISAGHKAPDKHGGGRHWQTTGRSQRRRRARPLRTRGREGTRLHDLGRAALASLALGSLALGLLASLASCLSPRLLSRPFHPSVSFNLAV